MFASSMGAFGWVLGVWAGSSFGILDVRNR